MKINESLGPNKSNLTDLQNRSHELDGQVVDNTHLVLDNTEKPANILLGCNNTEMPVVPITADERVSDSLSTDLQCHTREDKDLSSADDEDDFESTDYISDGQLSLSHKTKSEEYDEISDGDIVLSTSVRKKMKVKKRKVKKPLKRKVAKKKC